MYAGFFIIKKFCIFKREPLKLIDMSNYIKVFTGNFIEVQRVFNELQTLGICSVIRDESESGRLAGFGASIQGFQEIHVHKDELERTKPIIDNLNTELQS